MTKQYKTGISCPLAIPALFFAIGITTGRHGPALTSLFINSVLVFSFVITILLLDIRTKSCLKPLSIALVFFVIGNAAIIRVQPPHLDKQLETIAASGQDAVLSGILKTAPSFNGNKGKFIVDADQLRTKTDATIAISTRIILKTTFPPPANLGPGDRILARVSLAIPTPPGTPGSFDYRQYLLDRRIPITGFIRSPTYLSPLPPSLSSAKPGLLSTYLPQKLRHKTNLFIDSTNLPPKIRALYKAIITGQRDSIPITVLNNFKRTGAIHLLAISGMHMGLLALLSGLLINYILRKSSWLLLHWPVWKITAVLTLLIMAGYATISGLQPPVLRAFIMAAMFIVAIVFDRPKSILNTVALAALLILIYDPAALFSASFQLSFTAVTAIILFSNQFPGIFKDDKSKLTPASRCRLWFRTGIIISIVALFATAPITLYHFHQVSLLGPLTTILTAPLICFWALPLGLTATLFSHGLPNVATVILGLGSLGLSGAEFITATLATVPYAFRTLPPPHLITITIYYLIAAYLLFIRSAKTIKMVASALMILIMSIPINGFSLGQSSAQTKITFIDVGQGSSTLLELPGDITILVDGGGSSSPRFNPGEQIIGPFLWHQSIQRLNAIVISHEHQDHYNGLEFIIRNFRPAEIWINGVEGKSSGYREILKAAAETGAKIRIPDQGTVIATGGEAKLTSISNLHLRDNPALPTNSRSLVLKLTIGGKEIILPGDIMADDGQELIDQGVDLRSDVLLAPHHGSRNSAGYLLVQEGSPEWLIVSASPFSSENFPDPDFAAWCRQRGTTIHNTATSGATTFTVADNGRLTMQKISEKSTGRSNMYN